MIEYYLVDVKSIASKAPRSNFKVEEIETLANSILDTGGLLSPLLLEQTGAESYEVLVGDREYYAAVRAKEINPRSAEMVNAFVVPKKSTKAAVNQFKILYPDPDPIPPVISVDSDQRLTNLEARLDESLKDIKLTYRKDIQRLEQQISTLEEKIPQKVEPLETLNSASNVELLRKMTVAGIRGKTAEKLIKEIEKARKQSSFVSFADVVHRVRGLGDKRMLTILDAWQNIS